MTNNVTPTQHEVTLKEAFDLALYFMDANQSQMWWGPSGIGKTELAAQLATYKRSLHPEQKWNVIVFHTNTREPVDVRGIPGLDHVKFTTRWYAPDELPQVERDGECGVLLIDEINTGAQAEAMMAVCMQLVLDRRLGDYHLPKGWKIIATGNRLIDRAAAKRMPTALRNKLAHMYFKADVPTWIDWAKKNSDVPPILIAYIKFANDVRGIDALWRMPNGDENAWPTPRSITRCGPYVDAPNHLRQRLFAALIGDADAAEMDGYVALMNTFGSIDQIIDDPENAPVPTEPSLRYAISIALSRIAIRKNWDAIMTYINRLPAENQMLVVMDATERDASLKNTKAYGRYAVANKHLTVQAN